MTDIFARIRQDMEGAPSSDRLRDTIRLVSLALSDESEFRRQHEAAAANPLIDTPQAEAAQSEIVKAALKEQRLQAGAKLLDGKLTATMYAEAQAERTALYDAARAKRDDLVREFRQAWPKHVKPIVELLNRLQDVDAELAGIETPDDCDRLATADTLLNGAPQVRDDRYPLSIVMRRPPILDLVRLPVIDGAVAPAWNHEADRKAAEARAETVARFAAHEAA